MRQLIWIVLTAASLVLPSTGRGQAASTETFPSKPIRLVVPLPSGGPSDFIARHTAQHLSNTLGVPVVVDNKPGANGLIAAREVAAAEADGHTVLYAPASMIAAPLLAKANDFDWVRQLVPLGKVARVPFGLAVHPVVPARSVAELASLARAQPGALNVATSTPSEVMAVAQFMKASGGTLTRVPYRGGLQALPDLVAGRVQVTFGPLALLEPQARAGAVRILAVLDPVRSAALPDVPTMREAGFAGVSVPTWQGLYAPAGLHPGRQQRLTQAVASAASRPDAMDELARRMLAPDGASPIEMAESINRELAEWAALISEYKLTAD